MTISSEELERDKIRCLQVRNGFATMCRKYIAEVERLQAENREAQQFCRDADEAAHSLRVQVEAKDAEIARLRTLVDESAWETLCGMLHYCKDLYDSGGLRGQWEHAQAAIQALLTARKGAV